MAYNSKWGTAAVGSPQERLGQKTKRSSGYEEECGGEVTATRPREGMRTWNGKPRVALGRLKNELWCLLVLPRGSLAQNLTNIPMSPPLARLPRSHQGSESTTTTEIKSIRHHLFPWSKEKGACFHLSCFQPGTLSPPETRWSSTHNSVHAQGWGLG